MEWMAWTLPTAVFFIVIVLMLAGMTAWEIVAPNMQRKGFLPMETTRGDRLFIGLLTAAYIHLAWLGLTEWSIWGALIVALVALIVIMRWG
jgi:predicted small integral membrane protein